ncbi:efflux RND transporter periplasmic adaptor subunit [Clostridium sp. SHJSY1]|uniref:efflux RND transporter periplasmic adaptor subunit n=1 Tax=Clostridium sp. SHJSY1 TaxID=2942483 RepID=UPI0028758CD3|nr:efflux RND transporter periplasmic adaptor subunit [Clostridium sp. SHJSY1]MDS0525111.1 efflux RND transporter periplasmic adaptor subunit [Clostridium sp. SHJSY1]
MQKKEKKILIICLLICIVFITVYSGYKKATYNETSEIINTSKKILSKKINMTSSIKGTGSIYAETSRDIVANNNGEIKNLQVKVGDTVQQGEKLFESNSEELIKYLKDAETNLERQKLILENDTKSYNDSFIKISRVMNEVNEELSKACSELDKISSISKGSNEALIKNITDTVKDLDKEKSNLENYIKGYNDLLEKISGAINTINTPLSSIYEKLNKMIVKSPIDGIVVEVKSKNGDIIKGSIGNITGRDLEKVNEATEVLVIADRNNLNKKIPITANYDGILSNLNLKVGDLVKDNQNLFSSGKDILRENIGKIKDNLEKQKLALDNLKNSKKLEYDKLNIKDAEIQLSLAKDVANKMTITAPINGVITKVNKKNSELVTGINGIGTSSLVVPQVSTPILTIVDTSSLKVKVAVDELDIKKIKEGQKVEIRFDSINDKIYEGNIESIAQLGTSANEITNYNIIASIKDIDDIKVGMSANVSIIMDSKTDVLAVPTETVIEKEDKRYVKNKSGNIIEVKTGIENENYIEILDGIEEGEELLKIN